MHLATLFASLSLSSLAVVATPDRQQDQQVVFVPEEAQPAFEPKPLESFFQTMEEDPFDTAVRNKLCNKEDFNLEDEKQGEWEEGGVKGACYQYRAASGRFF